MRFVHWCLFVLVLGCAMQTVSAQQSAEQQAEKRTRIAKPNPAMAAIQDEPGLPRVLLIGDSISIGYTLPVRELLHGKANVHRILVNGGPTTSGLANIESWLGDKKWDVIHFNWGLHDLKGMPDRQWQVALPEYEANLKKLVERLKATSAKLIWCSTTPVPEGTLSPTRTNADVNAYKAAARKIMEAQGVTIDDLYAFAEPQLDKIQIKQNVHFTDAGSKVLAEQVARSILAALDTK